MKNLLFLLLILPLTSCSGQELGWFILSPNNVEGLNFFRKLRLVILPQAIKNILPALGNQFVYVLKMSSLVSIIGIGDLTRKANELVVSTYRPLEIYTFLILEYLILILIVSFFVRKLEKKLKQDGNN